MAEGIYIGINNTANQIKKAYIGINNTAKKITKIYVGDANGKAQEVYKSGSGVDPTKDSFTEEEFLNVIADGNQALMHIGALVTLSNTYCSTYEVIGVNHDNTIGTVDLMAHTQAGSQQFSSSLVDPYSTSVVRTWCNGTYFNAFDSYVRSASKTMNVVTYTDNGYVTTTDKVKILSLTEIGYRDGYGPTGEGSLYTGMFDPNVSTGRWRDAGTYGARARYWLRSKTTSSSSIDYRFIVSSSDRLDACPYNYTSGIVPVLRF